MVVVGALLFWGRKVANSRRMGQSWWKVMSIKGFNEYSREEKINSFFKTSMKFMPIDQNTQWQKSGKSNWVYFLFLTSVMLTFYCCVMTCELKLHRMYSWKCTYQWISLWWSLFLIRVQITLNIICMICVCVHCTYQWILYVLKLVSYRSADNFE